ncbi:MAG: OadG family protein [Romboutsia sp.]
MGNEIDLIDGLYISLSSMSVVFLILLVISVVLSYFRNIFKVNTDEEKFDNQSSKELALTDEDEEERVVVALAASIMVGQGKLNPNLHIKKITRIK